MTNTTTKRALLTSVMALLLCFTMLLGTTFAWFTESVSSGSNVIQSGNLDIEVEYTLGNKDENGVLLWNKLNGANDLFDGLWEPGHTEIVAFRIVNQGTLALKYAAYMNIENEKPGENRKGGSILLSDILTVSTITMEDADPDVVTTLEKVFTGENDAAWNAPVLLGAGNVLTSDQSLYIGDAQYIFVKVDMPQSVSNDANHDGVNAPSIDMGISVLATQYVCENDSFGPEYDRDATFGVAVKEFVTLTQDMTEAMIVDEGDSVALNMDGYTLSNTLTNNGEIVLSNGSIDSSVIAIYNYGNATFDSVSMSITAADGTGRFWYGVNARAGSTTTLKDVNLTVENGGGINAQEGAKVVFDSGSVNIASTETGQRYNVYAHGEGTEVTINGGSFSFDEYRKRSYVYAGGGAVVTINDGTFGPAPNHPSYTVPISADGSSSVIIKGGTFGFDPSAWVADGYTAHSVDGVWTVTAQ